MALKYKVGDKVRIKSVDWYNENKDKDGFVDFSTSVFVPGMSQFCGKIVTIKDVFEDIDDNVVYYMEDIVWDWTDEMIECLVERNGKTYPYKIGDRVIFKGNNRLATITDLKYNSFGNLSHYIKIDNDKDISTDCPTDLLLPYDNIIKGCVEEEIKPEFKIGDKITNGKVTLTILTLSSDRYVVEDNFGECGTLYFNSQDEWKIVKEEIKSKFKVGDRIITDTNMKGTIIEVVEKGWYRVEFEPHNNIPQPNGIVPEENMLLVEEKCNYVQADNIPDITQAKTSSACSHNGFYGYSDSDGNEISEWNLPEGYQFIDENGNIINATKVVLEKKKKKYPKTYEECCEILGLIKVELCFNADYRSFYASMEQWKKLGLMNQLYQLLVCRDAYWKLCGDEMGLGKPWEPDWNNQESPKYCIAYVEGQAKNAERYIVNTILSFPTPETRDAFYGNFKELIESVKELL